MLLLQSVEGGEVIKLFHFWSSYFYLVSSQFILSLLQLTGGHASLDICNILLQVQQSFPVIVHLVRGVSGDHLVVVLAGARVSHGHLEAHLGGPAVGVQQGGRHLDLVLHQQAVQTNADLTNKAIVEEPEGQLYRSRV